MAIRTNYSRGYVVEYHNKCFDSWLLLPAEELWNNGLRGFLYILAMFYVFLGIAIVADIFMSSIEVITSKKRKVLRYDPERGEKLETEIFFWNETVANLTLMALGSSAPEILLAVIETIQELGIQTNEDSLGTFTIVGSASFNLFLITAICVVSVPACKVKKIHEFGVFMLTSVWSMFAYVWLVVVLRWSSPNEVKIWEAWVTFAFFPLLVLTAWCQDNGWWYHRKGQVVSVEPPNVRVVGITDNPNPFMVHRSMELKALEQQRFSATSSQLQIPDERIRKCSEHDFQEIAKSKDRLKEVIGMWKSHSPSETDTNKTAESVVVALKKIKANAHAAQNSVTTRARFRHAAMKAVVGKKKPKTIKETEVSDVNLAVLEKSLFLSKARQNDEPTKHFRFTSATYSVLKSTKTIRAEVTLSRKLESKVVSPSTPRKRFKTLPAPYNPHTPIRWGGVNKPVLISGSKVEVNGVPPNHLNKPKIEGTMNPADKFSDGSDHSDTEQDEQILRPTPLEKPLTVDYETRDGMAKHNKDYYSTKGTLTFTELDSKQGITINMIHNEGYANDRDFYIILKNPSVFTDLGEPNIARITIIDNDEPGDFLFEQASYHANFVTKDVTLKIIRTNGCDGVATISYNTLNGTGLGASANELEQGRCDYEFAFNQKLIFQHGETSKQIAIGINPESKNTNFMVILHSPSPGAHIGQKSAAVVNISSDVDDIVERVANIITAEDEESLSKSWRAQFEEAVQLRGEEDENGQEEPLSCCDFLLHFVTFFWKVLFAFIPPRNVGGGWPAFFASLLLIAVLTAIVEQLGKLLGCVIGLKNSVTGITIIAIGTSLPDTFASRSAALQDIGADASIGNITGSNSVNVFLGLGVPWIISTAYYAWHNKPYIVDSGNMTFSVVTFLSCGAICLVLLVFRRVVHKGELGGPAVSKYLSGFLLFFLWLIYVVLSSLVAYGHLTVKL